MILEATIETVLEVVAHLIPWPNWLWTVAGGAAVVIGIVLFWSSPAWVAWMVVAAGLLMLFVGIFSQDRAA